MKNIILIFLILTAVSCKKKTITLATPAPTCETKSKLFEGKFVSNTQYHDTITIVFLKNNCPLVDINNYNVYGLGKALKGTGTAVVFDYTKVYYLTSNEVQKSASTSMVTCDWGFNTNGTLNCSYQAITPLIFTKIN